MEQPVVYYQTDPRWKNVKYAVQGESSTIGSAGCGPTAMSMVLATWADKDVTPKTEAAWALANGYKCYHNGTYYAYFEPAGARYHLKVQQLNWTSLYHNPSSVYHQRVKEAIENNHLVIACMGPGTWTSSGHFVLVYNIIGNTIYINDPASSKSARTQGNYSTFKNEVKYYFVIENPNTAVEVDSKDADYYVTVTATSGLKCRVGAGTSYNWVKTYTLGTKLHIMKELNEWGYTGDGWIYLPYTSPVTNNYKPKEAVEKMTKLEFINSLTDEEAYTLVSKAMTHAATLKEGDWSVKEGGLKAAKDKKIINNGEPKRFLTREEMAAILYRLGLLK